MKNVRPMADSPTKCPQCGARPRGEGTSCEFCGTRLPPPPVETVVVAESAPRRFERLESHPQLEHLLRKQPSATGPIVSGVVGTMFALAFVVIAGVMVFLFQFTGPLVIVPIVVLCIGLFTLARTLRQSTRLASADLVAAPVLVADLRTQVSGGGDGPAHTRYYVTIERRDGSRNELVSSPKLAGRIARGDMGVAYVKADTLIDFERVQV